MINPHTCYILGFVVSLLVYQLGWSELYPRLSWSLLSFLMITFVAHAFFARRSSIHRQENTDNKVLTPVINPWYVTIFLYVLWVCDFIYEGGIPLLKIMLGVSYDYKKFGVPVLHVFVVTFCSFYCIYLLYLFLKRKEKVFLVLYMVNMASAILIYSRSMLFFNLASSFFLYLICLDKIPYLKLVLLTPLVLLIFYFFGVVGTKRVSFEWRQPYNADIFLDNGKASAEFRTSSVPKEFFWSYFYISSPLANLQVNIETYTVKPITTSRVLEYINNELLFESISKRINKITGVEREGENTVKEPFNVSTVYSRSYSYLGWEGMIVTALVVLVIPLFYERLLIGNQLYSIGMALLCCTYLFLTYDNTIRLMALGFQLIYPFLFLLVEKKVAELTKR